MDDPTPEYLRSPFYGIESHDTTEIHRALRACRVYVRRHLSPEGVFDAWTIQDAMQQRLMTALKTFDLLNLAILPQFHLTMSALWLWPTCVMVIMHKPSRQWISIRAHAMVIPQADIPTTRAMAQAGALIVLLGAANQTNDFETHVQRMADNVWPKLD
jgi:hypothetical protein